MIPVPEYSLGELAAAAAAAASRPPPSLALPSPTAPKQMPLPTSQMSMECLQTLHTVCPFAELTSARILELCARSNVPFRSSRPLCSQSSANGLKTLENVAPPAVCGQTRMMPRLFPVHSSRFIVVMHVTYPTRAARHRCSRWSFATAFAFICSVEYALTYPSLSATHRMPRERSI